MATWPQLHAHYVFYGDGTACCGDNEPPNNPNAGPIQDPLSIIVRYSNGHYDQQSYALWLPNTGNTDPGNTQANYVMGMGAFCAAVHGPELMDINGNPYDVATLFFGADEYGQDQGQAVHMIGVATSFDSPDAGSPNNHITFNFTKWNDSTSPNYTGLKSYVGPGRYAKIGESSVFSNTATVWVDPYDPATQQTYPSTFTPFLARIATRSGDWISRFNTMAAFFIDNHFYLIVGLGGSTDRPALCFRIPFNATDPAGLGHTSSGAVAVDMWYTNDSGQAGFWPIDSTKPILFTDDDGATSALYNPPVPLANAELKDNTGALVQSPAGGFPYPLTGTPQALWLTSTYPFGGVPVKVHRFAYNYSNPSNPFTITTPYRIDMSSGNCTPIGACKLPSTYNAINPPIAAIYPLDTSGNTFGFVAAVDASCNSTYYGSGLLPFTVSGMNLY